MRHLHQEVWKRRGHGRTVDRPCVFPSSWHNVWCCFGHGYPQIMQFVVYKRLFCQLTPNASRSYSQPDTYSQVLPNAQDQAAEVMEETP